MTAWCKVGNGKLIASRIPGAKLVLLANASHIFPTDQADASIRRFWNFWQRSRPAPAPRPEEPRDQGSGFGLAANLVAEHTLAHRIVLAANERDHVQQVIHTTRAITAQMLPYNTL